VVGEIGSRPDRSDQLDPHPPPDHRRRPLQAGERDVVSGSSKRSTCVRLVWSSRAIFALEIFSFFVASASCQATTSFTAPGSSVDRLIR
jgi:hypothetical protein